MATLGIQPIRLQRGYTEHHGHLGIEAPNQTFKDGVLIRPNTAGTAFQATAAGADAVGAKNKVSCGRGQNLAAPLRKVPYVDPPIANFFEITAGGAVATAALIKVGAQYGYNLDGAGNPYLDLANTTNLVFQIEDAVPVAGILGDTNVRVYASILPGAR